MSTFIEFQLSSTVNVQHFNFASEESFSNHFLLRYFLVKFVSCKFCTRLQINYCKQNKADGISSILHGNNCLTYYKIISMK